MVKNKNCADILQPERPNMQAIRGIIGYALRRAQLSVFDDLIQTLEEFHLRPANFSVLYVINENPGLNQSEISSALGIQKTNFVQVVDRLEKAELIKRCRAKHDRRSHALYLTDKGAELFYKAREQHKQHEKRMIERLGPNGREQLLPLLWRLTSE
ncbi:MarR family winged helix-turn-helix transcriptional regulator [Chelativorans composti]